MLEVSAFTEGQIVHLPDLAQSQGLESDAFTVVARLHGGMGSCAKIRNESSGAIYALKTIRSTLIEDQGAWGRFVEEMKVWLTLSPCDGIVEAHCIVRVNELPCICAQWMEGGSLRSLMSLRDPTFFYASVDRLVRTLEWAYARHRIIHRDLKPENILLDRVGLVYISDWGLARPLAKENKSANPSITRQNLASRSELTQAGEFLGTIFYASPEQIRGSKSIDLRSDIYSLGCILYEWETGLLPFVGNTAEEIAYQHLYQPAPRPGGLFRGTTFGAEDIIARCLEKDPSQRFPDYVSLMETLLDVSQRRGVRFTPYLPRERYAMPQVGAEEFPARLRSGDLGGVRSRNGAYGVTEFEKLEPYLQEAFALVGLGEWQKAHDILAALFVPEMARALPDDPICQVPTVDYAICLIELGRPAEAVVVLQCLSGARLKPAEYFVNLSLAYLHLNKPQEAERVAQAGLAVYGNDKDILGNLVISLIHQKKFSEALEPARTRIQLGRDVHSLEELAVLLMQLGHLSANSDWPNAVTHYRTAVDLLLEAKQLNPRYTSARFSLAQAWFDLGKYSAASQELGELAEIPMHQSLAEPWAVLMAMCLDRTAAHKECMEFCDRWLKKLQESIELQRIRAETIIDGFCIGKEKDGVRIVDQSSLEFFTSIVKQPDKRRASDFRYLARLHEWMGDIDAARAALDEAKSLEPDSWEIPFIMATFQWRQGHLEGAASSALTAIQIAPWRPQTWRLLAEVNRALGHEQDAAIALERAEMVDGKRKELTN